MRGLWISLAVLILAVPAGCQAATGSPIASVYTDQNSNGPILNVTQPQDESVVRSNPLVVSGNASPGAEVTINDITVAVESGHFRLTVDLEPGPNSIDISVKDDSGRQVYKEITVVYVP